MTTSTQRMERLTKALEVMSLPVKELPVDIFDMGDWGNNYSGRTGCQTAACGAGTLALHPWFRRRGFRGVWADYGELRLSGDGEGGWRVKVSEFFGLTNLESFALTVSSYGVLDGIREYDGNTTKRQFCARLRRLIKHYTKTDEPLHADDV